MAEVWPVRFSDELTTRRAAFAKEETSGKGEDGTALTPEQLRQDRSDLVDYESFVEESKKLRRVFPTMTFTDRLTLIHGGREFRFLSVTGDAEGTTVLYLPMEKVLITGDAVSYPIPYVSRRPTSQAESLRMLSQLDADVILPGHGPPSTTRGFCASSFNFWSPS
jgi:glyoxylase-like metal-dependent hydrolase (beta-lactamase superfamily II)